MLLTLVEYLCFNSLSESKVNVVAMNDYSNIIAENWDDLQSTDLSEKLAHIDYSIIDIDNNLLKSSNNKLYKGILKAIENRDSIIDITKNSEIIGKLIIHNDTNKKFTQYKYKFMLISVLFSSLIVIAVFIYFIYLNRIIIKPFHKLKKFARQIAIGNFDVPLEMNKENWFGAFTESFDIMREELYKAKENEKKATQSKNELVATLSHDVKTPIASIKSIAELLYFKLSDENLKEQMMIINKKSDQINKLTNDMFDATLEELDELKVEINEYASHVIFNIIKEADYNNFVKIIEISDCIINIDYLRFSQIVDNIIINSYKYANTDIEITSNIKDDFLKLEFKDYGNGILDDENVLIFKKFYRGKNSKGKNGNGLGLYISKYLIEKMNGKIEYENSGKGFIINIYLRLS
jgi:signal transduction histidine kinase